MAPKNRSKKVSGTENVMCLICAEDLLAKDTIKLKCSCIWCKGCIEDLFERSTKDMSLMPPKCCNKPIQTESVESFIDPPLQTLWNKKFTEHTTSNKLYCPAPHCSAFIPTSRITPVFSNQLKRNRKLAICPLCKHKACAECKHSWHREPNCPNEENDRLVASMAAKFGWKKCPGCGELISRPEGCNHMTCNCGCSFCYRCGGRYTTTHECPRELAGVEYAPEEDKNKFHGATATERLGLNPNRDRMLSIATQRVQQQQQQQRVPTVAVAGGRPARDPRTGKQPQPQPQQRANEKNGRRRAA